MSIFSSPIDESARPASAQRLIGSVFSWLAVITDLFLIALVWWFTAFVAGAHIDKDSVYTGPVGATGAAYMVIGLALSVVSTALTLGMHWCTAKGSSLRVRTWGMWMGAHAIFVLGTVANNILVNLHIR